MTKREQLTELIGYFAHGNKSEFGRLLDMSPSCITAWLRRDTFDAGLVSLKFPQVSREWLLTGEGAMLTDTAATETAPTKAERTYPAQTLKTLIARVKYVKNLRQDEVAQALGITPTYLSDMINGRAPYSENFKRKLYEVYSDCIAVPNVPEPEPDTAPQVLVTRPHLPISAAAGLLSGISEGVTPAQCEQMPLVPHTPDYDFTISIRGDSMEPEFHGGDILAVKRVREFVEWGKPHIIDCTEGALLKVVYEESETQYRFVSLNREKYPDIVANRSCVSALFKIVAVLRTYD